MKVAVFSKIHQENQIFNLRKLLKILDSFGVIAYVHTTPSTDIICETAGVFRNREELLEIAPDFLFSLGGDGTLLDSILLIKNTNIPVLGINTGRLGFLANNQMEDIPQIMDWLNAGEFTKEERTLVELQSFPDLFGDENCALNEFTIHKGDSSSLVKITVLVNNELFNTYWCDGLILATPTGSTAYSMSCGGPIVFPQSNTFILTPVAPHNLNVRPVILPDDMAFTFSISGRNRKFLISLDSRYRTIDESVKLIVRKAPFNISMVKFKNQIFNKILREKLNWGLDQRNTS